MSALPPLGAHVSVAGGMPNAIARATSLGCTAAQIFVKNGSQWRWKETGDEEAAAFRAAHAASAVGPLVAHASYLINLCSQSDPVRANSIKALRGEIERALALSAEYLVLHPGSWKGLTREEGLRLAVDSMARALDGLPWDQAPFTLLIENTAGAEFSLGASLQQVAEVIARLQPVVRVAACLDTCHTHVAGYDMVSAQGYEATMRQIEKLLGFETVRVWHMNDAKTPRGSHLDRHEHIGEGTLGIPPFRRLLNDPRFAHAAFIAETPVDQPDDDLRNLSVLRSLIARASSMASYNR